MAEKPKSSPEDTKQNNKTVSNQQKFDNLKEIIAAPAAAAPVGPTFTVASSSFDQERRKEVSEASIKLDGLQRFYKMRDQWSTFLKFTLGFILIFNVVLVFLVGLEILKFGDEWFLRLVLGTNLADIIGLVYLVVKFLFSNNDSVGQTAPAQG